MLFRSLCRHAEIGANSYLLDTGNARVVLDAGLHPKHDGPEAIPRYDLLEEGSIDSVVITHAHLDHIGSLPVLLHRQPQAKAFFSPAAAELGTALKSRGMVLALAESCTGGWTAQCITAVAGSSAWFDRGFVTYSNAAKQEMLGVPADTINSYGAVSPETARAMALGALRYSRADIAAAITGIAGPDGGSADKPVGTVCLAWATRNGRILDVVERFSGDREDVRRQSVNTALSGLLQLTLNLDL